MNAFRHVFEDGEDAMRAPRKLRDVTADLPFSRRGDALRCRHNSHASQLGNHDSHRKDLNLVASLLKLGNTCNCRKVQSVLKQESCPLEGVWSSPFLWTAPPIGCNRAFLQRGTVSRFGRGRRGWDRHI